MFASLSHIYHGILKLEIIGLRVLALWKVPKQQL